MHSVIELFIKYLNKKLDKTIALVKKTNRSLNKPVVKFRTVELRNSYLESIRNTISLKSTVEPN